MKRAVDIDMDVSEDDQFAMTEDEFNLCWLAETTCSKLPKAQQPVLGKTPSPMQPSPNPRRRRFPEQVLDQNTFTDAAIPNHDHMQQIVESLQTALPCRDSKPVFLSRLPFGQMMLCN